MRRKKCIGGILTFLVIISMLSVLAYAKDDSVSFILCIKEFDPEISYQYICAGKSYDLPEKVSIKTNEDESWIETEILGWMLKSTGEEIDKDNLSTAGEHILVPLLDEKYNLSNCKVPEVTIIVRKTSALIEGIDKSLKAKAGEVLYDEVTVKDAGGRDILLQEYDGDVKEWITKKRVETACEKEQSIKIIYPSCWWKKEKTKWRLLISENDSYCRYVSEEINIVSERYYQNPKGYYQIKDQIILNQDGGYTLYLGYMGLKVKRLNSYFGIGDKNWPRYTKSTKKKVKAFQKKHSIKATGNCGKKTWLMIGKVQKAKKGTTVFTEKSWNTLGAYVYPVKTQRDFTKKEYIECLIETAYEYLGDPYTVGAAGKPGQGVDCSGLVIQACYSCGIDLSPTSVIRHAKPEYEYESRQLFKNSKLKKISWKNKKRGDLIFYYGQNLKDTICHVAIYLGNGKIIHSIDGYNRVIISDINGPYWGKHAGVRRIFV